MDDALALSALVLALSGQLVQEIHTSVSQQGFADLRPAHGFAFVRISAGGATTADLAEHLGVTKQAAPNWSRSWSERGTWSGIHTRTMPAPASWH